MLPRQQITLTDCEHAGHTVGYHWMMVHLPRTGWMILTGDVAHFTVDFARDLVPLGNANRADTIASINRIRDLAAHNRTRVLVQDAADVFASMPRFHAYLDKYARQIRGVDHATG